MKEPLVMCLTNTVAANFTANVLLALGAKPAMMEEPCEAAELAAVSDAVLINVGTITESQRAAQRAAVKVCRAANKPWVLDPVAVNALAFRRDFVLELLSEQPSLIRGNIAEISFLREIASAHVGSVPMLATGETDTIYVGTDPVEQITGGVAMLQRVTATGCAQGAVCAAFLGWGQTPLEAARSASRLMKAAGERAWAKAQKPGAFQMALLDALDDLRGAYLGVKA